MKCQDSGESMPIHSTLLRGANHLKCWPDFAQVLDLKPSARRHSTGISHSVPLTGTRHHLDVWPALALSTSLIFVPHHAPTVYWREISDRLLRQLQRATFSSCRSFKSHRLAARMQCHEGMHLLEQGSDSPRNEQMLPIGGANIQILAIRALSVAF
jgi:hypothetical protein